MDIKNAGGLVALIVGLVAALATVVVALVNSRQSLRDARENLKRDIDLAKELQDGSRAKEMLERLIAKEISDLGLAQSMKTERLFILRLGAAAIAGASTLLGFDIAEGRQNVVMTIRVLAVVAILLFLFGVAVAEPTRRRRQAEFRLESPPESQFWLRVRSALHVERFKAALAVLTAEEKPAAGRDD